MQPDQHLAVRVYPSCPPNVTSAAEATTNKAALPNCPFNMNPINVNPSFAASPPVDPGRLCHKPRRAPLPSQSLTGLGAGLESCAHAGKR